jgi:hypothetical protein
LESITKALSFKPSDEAFGNILKEAEAEILIYEKYCQDDSNYFEKIEKFERDLD